jgi:zona occludens toxin
MRPVRSLRRQLGFLYLTTGGNGTGKTLFTLHDVRKLQLETGRPVYFWGFDAKQPLLDFGWQPFEPERWQDLPDGSLCIVDECQRVLPVRGTGKPPDWVQAIAEVHRKRGFDFFFITQHPLNFDAFVRRLIASPGWHRHFKASTMGDSSNELKWSAVKDNPQVANSSAMGEVTSRPFPREVYGWYTSASLHTAKKRVPLKVWGAIVGVIAAFGMIGFAVWHFLGYTGAAAKSKPGPNAGATLAKAFAPDAAPMPGRSERAPLTTAEYLQQRKPRLPDFPHTAPAYDDSTRPTVAPYPAACVAMGSRCDCYTQQGTYLRTSADVCLQIVKYGFFVDWQQPAPQSVDHRRRELDQPRRDAPSPAQPPVVINMPAQAHPVPQPGAIWSQGLAARNSEVRSELGR